MRPVSYSALGEKSSPRFAKAFAAGCGGSLIEDLSCLRLGAFAAFCSPAVYSLLTQAQAEGRDWYYGDHGYVHRHQYFRITKNRYQHDGRGDASPHRFRELGLSVQQAWQTTGSTIVVCPNSSVYMQQFAGVTADRWTEAIVAQLASITDRPVRVHWKTQVSSRPLVVDLPTAWMVVTFSSAAAIEALMAGVPVCTLAPWAATARMGITDLTQVESPVYPDDREPFLWTLAANQWTLEEIRSGIAWRALQEKAA